MTADIIATRLRCVNYYLGGANIFWQEALLLSIDAAEQRVAIATEVL